MRSLVQNRPKNITLKQYISNNNLRKRLSSRSNSREIKSSSIQSKNSSIHQSTILTSLTKPQLINDIKMKLTEFISDDMKLAMIIRMIDRLVQLFNYERQESLKESVLLTSMLKENTSVKKSSNKFTEDPRFNLSTLDEQNLKISNMISTQNEQKRQRKKSITLFHHIRQNSNESQQIPDINLLLKTRRQEPEPCNKYVELETQETLPNYGYEEMNNGPHNNSHINIFVAEDKSIFETNRSQKCAPKLPQITELKKDDSLIRMSIRSSLWKQAGEENILNKYQDFKKRKER